MNVSVVSRGTEYPLDDGSLCYLNSIDGIGAAQVRRFAHQGALQHGSTDKGFLLNPRTIRIGLAVVAASLEEFYERREELITLFSPSESLVLRITRDDGAIRDIDFVFDSDLSMPITADAWTNQTSVVVLKAGNPAFYDPAGEATSFVLGGGSDLGEVPMAVPMKVGASEIDSSVEIQYSGNWHEFPVIRIVGQITDPVITNNTTGEVLDFTGYNIGTSDEIVIDLRYGRKTVVKNGTTNVIDKLTSSSDLATFHLEARRSGETYRSNSIAVTGSGVNPATRIEISYYNRYRGV